LSLFFTPELSKLNFPNQNIIFFTDQKRVLAVATMDTWHESSRQEDNTENDSHEQPHEGNGAQGAVF
jgi:hypothetical protein